MDVSRGRGCGLAWSGVYIFHALNEVISRVWAADRRLLAEVMCPRLFNRYWWMIAVQVAVDVLPTLLPFTYLRIKRANLICPFEHVMTWPFPTHSKTPGRQPERVGMPETEPGSGSEDRHSTKSYAVFRHGRG